MKIIFTKEESELDKLIHEFCRCILVKYCIEIDKMMMEGLNDEAR